MITKPMLWINHLNRIALKLSAFCLLLLMLLCCTVVIMRYGFASNSIALQEAMVYCHGAAFLLAAAFTLQVDGHVRVDIFYQHFNKRQKAWVNSLGFIIFALPFIGFLLATSYFQFVDAWQIKEASPEPGGLPFVYLLKGLIPLSMLLLLLQSLLLLTGHLAAIIKAVR